ncbi:MAG: hypothetical protein ACYC1M_01205 [Armatimonadota bacterium]
MKVTLLLFLLSLICCLPSGASLLADGTSAEAPHSPWKLLFSDSQDITDVWGKLDFGVTPVKLLRECEHPGFTVVGSFPLPDGSWEVFGQQMTEIKPGNPRERIMNWKLLRCTTRDGAHFENLQTVYEDSAVYTEHLAIAKNGDTGEYLVLKLKVDISGFAYTAFFSPDGVKWKEYADNPLFYDGDAMSLFWSPVLHSFVCINKSLQPFRKHIIDHGGPTGSLKDDSLRDRRVLMMRSSTDGRSWNPNVSLPDVWDLQNKKGSIPAKYLTKPDKNDPPDLEFYSGNAFWYYDRAYMMVLNYAPSAAEPGKHAPQLDNEWWTSRDGLHWDRPARGLNTLEVFPQIPRLETHPMVVGGNIVFCRNNMLLGMPEDRISYVGARANGEFSTKPFTMPDTGIVLNASVPSADRKFLSDRAYLMVAVLDEKGRVIPGFEAEKCIIRKEDRIDIPLKWSEATSKQLAGKTVKLRFLLGSASIYAVTPGK